MAPAPVMINFFFAFLGAESELVWTDSFPSPKTLPVSLTILPDQLAKPIPHKGRIWIGRIDDFLEVDGNLLPAEVSGFTHFFGPLDPHALLLFFFDQFHLHLDLTDLFDLLFFGGGNSLFLIVGAKFCKRVCFLMAG